MNTYKELIGQLRSPKVHSQYHIPNINPILHREKKIMYCLIMVLFPCQGNKQGGQTK